MLALSSTGASKYWEFETTGRYLANEHRDLTVSYVRSHSTRDLNDYDQFFGNFRNPIIRPNENSLSPTDVPNRIIVRGTLGLPGQVGLLAALRVAHGFPWSAVNEFQDFVGARNRTGRLPRVSTLDFSLVAAVEVQEVPLQRRREGLQHASTARAIATCRTTSRRRTTGTSTTRSSARSGSSFGTPK